MCLSYCPLNLVSFKFRAECESMDTMHILLAPAEKLFVSNFPLCSFQMFV